MDLQALAKRFGTVVFEHVEYILTREADFSNRMFPGWYGDAEEGEEYTVEFSCDAIADGNEYQVYWQFSAVKGEEPEADEYPFDEDHISRVLPQ